MNLEYYFYNTFAKIKSRSFDQFESISGRTQKNQQ